MCFQSADTIETKRQDLAIAAWNLMDASIEWSALEIMVELLGIDDVRIFIAHLIAIRDHKERQAAR